ncbi:roadblock/LC7 domain-containing protein [Streptomyces sp. NBC_01235]|uniref:roadblock/LC7 domain-containing protein n=1 Tax=Streptomyces sp. NBC_01235 TaxID=2903788 RepID=UPI002E0EB83D|nr:roadblock/LC7 domain-containing protein [Streptomyces sp. NBC_01235]
MAVEAEVLNELHRLRSRMPQLTGALAAGVDGLVLAQDMADVEPEGLAALTAAALAVGCRMADLAARGEFRELLVRGAGGYLATYAAGPSAVLTLLADDRANVGRLHLEGRRSGARIAELVATRFTEDRPVVTRGLPTPPSAARGRTLGALPIRIPPQSRYQP